MGAVSKTPSEYVWGVALALVPVGVATTVAWLARGAIAGAGAGSIVGVAFGLLWLGPTRTPRRLLIAVTLGIVAPSIGAQLEPQWRIVAHGVPAVAATHVAGSDSEALEIRSGALRLDRLGQATVQLQGRQPNHRFVAPVVAASAPDRLLDVWVGCRHAGPDMAAEKTQCLGELTGAKLVVRRADLAIYRQALEDASKRHGLPAGPAPRIYELADAPVIDAFEDVLPLLAIVVVLGAAGVVSTHRRRRTLTRVDAR